jgi:murein DD-endopeptidase MepM/ murein hydrolase activator NlpD
LTLTAAGFVVLGGFGAIWSHRPTVIEQASARDFAGAEALGELARADLEQDQVPAWARRLFADIAPAEFETPEHDTVPSASGGHYYANLSTGALPPRGADRTALSHAVRAKDDDASSAGAMVTRLLDTPADIADAMPPLVDVDLLAEQVAEDWRDEFALGATPIADAIARETQKIIEVQRGDTLFGLLVDAGLSRTEASDAIGAIEDVFAPRNLRAGQEITLSIATISDRAAEADPQLVSLSFEPSVTTDVTLSRSDGGAFVAKAIDKPLVERRVRAAARIDSSLFDAAREAGLPVSVISSLIRTFSFDIDFQRDIQPGDSFEILYERVETEDGVFAKAGRILFASLDLSGNVIPVYFYERDGEGEYYNGVGETIRKTLLRTPIDGARITSGFGMRQHPLLGYSKMHKGVDFGAPTGTPIFAAGTGTIVDIQRRSDYGNYVKIRHNGQYQTLYAHMSKFAKSLKKGDKVSQGDVIGYVGSTGRSTGPHLHYEVLVGGEAINPGKLKDTGGDKLVGKELKTFKDYVASIDAERVRQAQQQLIAESMPADGTSCEDAIGCQN